MMDPLSPYNPFSSPLPRTTSRTHLQPSPRPAKAPAPTPKTILLTNLPATLPIPLIRSLIRHNPTIYLHAATATHATTLRADIMATARRPTNIRILDMNMSSTASIRRAITKLSARESAIDALIDFTGVTTDPSNILELLSGVLPLLESASSGPFVPRIIHVTSEPAESPNPADCEPAMRGVRCFEVRIPAAVNPDSLDEAEARVQPVLKAVMEDLPRVVADFETIADQAWSTGFHAAF